MAEQRTVSLAVRIHGRVQGVGFRAWTIDKANALELDGWVRNCSDGAVEALFAGGSAAVEAMIEACGSGPMFARVTRIERRRADPPSRQGFTYLPTT